MIVKSCPMILTSYLRIRCPLAPALRSRLTGSGRPSMRVTSEAAESAAEDQTLRDVARRLPGRILGIDAGGSGTRVVMLEAGELTSLPAGPPMNALLTDGFTARLEEIIRAAGATAAGIGVPGLRQHNDATRLAEALTRQSG